MSEKLKLSFVAPHQALYDNQEVTQVNVPAVSGDLGVLASHVPSIEALRPGLVEVIESSGTAKRFFGRLDSQKKLTHSLERFRYDPP